MTPDEALDTLQRIYHSPLLGVVREELERLRSEVIGWQTLAGEAGAEMEKLRARIEELADDCRELSQMGFEDARNELRGERDAMRHDIERHVAIAAEQAQELERLQADLAVALERVKDHKENSELFSKLLQKAESDLSAARALLREARQQITVTHARHEILRDRIDAALAGERKL